MIPQIEVDAFWAATVECLVRYHGYTHEDARGGIAQFRERISRARISDPEKMVYHDEPFNVACDIAGRELDRFGIIDEYERLLDDTWDHAALELEKNRGTGMN